MLLNELQKRIEKSKELDFGSIFEQCTDLFKKVWIHGFVVVLMIVIFSLGLSYVFGLIGLSADIYTFNEDFSMESVVALFSLNALYSIPQTILISTISIALMAGFYRICKNYDLGERVETDYFYFFDKGNFGKVFMLGIIQALIVAVTQFLFLIPYIYAFVPLAYFSIILANNPNLSEMEIVKASFSLGNKKWLITFGTMFVTGILGMLGVLACGIGLLFTISIGYLPVFYIYKGAVGFDDRNEIDKIGKPIE